MCLQIKERYKTRKAALAAAIPHIAKKDIIVYKRLDYRGRGRYISPFQYMEWRRGYEYYQDNDALGIRIEGISRTYNIQVYEGLHANMKPDLWSGKQYTMIVPKGAKYFLGTSGDIVATRMIFPHK